jgi:uncharacterized membrane protein HdeD (DUF308 family)
MTHAFGIFADLALIAGIVLMVAGIRKKYHDKRILALSSGAVLLAIGIWFGAWDLVGTATENGYGEAIENSLIEPGQ